MDTSSNGAVSSLQVSVVIPTFGCKELLIDKIKQFLAQIPRAAEILVLDQTKNHELETERSLKIYQESGDIQWIQFGPPSQPAALNRGDIRWPVTALFNTLEHHF